MGGVFSILILEGEGEEIFLELSYNCNPARVFVKLSQGTSWVALPRLMGDLGQKGATARESFV